MKREINREEKPELISDKLGKYLFQISDANRASKDGALDEELRTKIESFLGDESERKEKGLMARSFISNFGIGTIKIDDQNNFYHRLVILDQEKLKETFSQLFNELQQFSRSDAHDVIVDILYDFNSSSFR